MNGTEPAHVHVNAASPPLSPGTGKDTSTAHARGRFEYSSASVTMTICTSRDWLTPVQSHTQ